MARRFYPHVRSNAIGYLALFVALGGTGAYAATSFIGSDGQIYGCVSKHGALTVLKPGKQCGTGKRSLAWNQHGQNGVEGIQGVRGETGPQGAPGATGPQGPGAIQNSQHADDHGTSPGFPTYRGINNVEAYISCDRDPPGKVTLILQALDTSHELQLSGTEANNGALSNVHRSGGYIYSWSATTNEDLDVIAKDTSVDKWTRFDLGSYYGGSAGCNLWGLVTPPSN